MANTYVTNQKNDVLTKKSAFLAIMTSFFTHFNRKNAVFVCFFIFSALPIMSQQSGDRDVESSLQRIIEDFIEFNEGEAEFDFNTLYDDLLILYRKKINLNSASTADLEKLLFLSSVDVQNIVSYRETYGDFLAIYELQSVPGLTFDKIASLRLFVEVNESNVHSSDLTLDELSRSKNQIFLKWKYNIETARGFISENGADPKFIGDKNHLYLRYNHAGTNSRYGLILEKDPGEKFINDFSETKVDYLSLHYQVNNPTNWIRQMNLGDYSVSLGQGLVAHNNFGIGKSSYTTSIKKGRQGIRAFNSVTENLAFRGAAVDIEPLNSPIRWIAFASYTPRDANLTGVNANGWETFSSFPSSGLHRTSGERTDQDAVNETVVGSSLRYTASDLFQLNANIIHQKFDKFLEFNRQPYQLFNWEGTQLTNYSLDYNLLIKGWNVFGEIARSSSGGYAQLHGLIKTLDPSFDISLVYRNYQPEYQSIYANGFGESNTVNNERGIYLGVDYRLSRKWSVKAYADQWQNDWLRFRVDGPSRGTEYLFRIDFNERRKRNYYVQYRHEVKDENSSADLLIDRPVNKTIQRIRLHANHFIGNGIELRSRVEFSFFEKGDLPRGKADESENGILIYQDIISRKVESPFTLRARVSYFNITDFNARIYTYENDLLYEYFIPSFSGEGFRYYVHGRYNISKNIMAELRWEQTQFIGAETIRSGDNLIDGNTTSRIKAQVRITF